MFSDRRTSGLSAVRSWVVVGRLTRADRAFRSMPDDVGSGEPTHDDKRQLQESLLTDH